ncbi:MAG: AAA family ATPase [Elusimicrobiota bacterium]
MNLSTQLLENVEKSLFGKTEVAKRAVCCLLAEGHLLIDDIPGVGKTTLATALSQALGGSFRRIQFTSDLLPTDILGVSIFDQKNSSFDFKPGPIFSNIILADEINRASPKTQSALLECMQEGQVSIDNKTHLLPKPFFVIATQNPQEHFGTFPLPESQLDRFLMRIEIGYPDQKTEISLLKKQSEIKLHEKLNAVTSPEKITEVFQEVKKIHVDSSLDEYIVQLVSKTRESGFIKLGVSPRGALALRKAAQAYAFMEGRDFLIPDDIQKIAASVMAHRLVLNNHISLNGNSFKSAQALIEEIIHQTPVPV